MIYRIFGALFLMVFSSAGFAQDPAALQTFKESYKEQRAVLADVQCAIEDIACIDQELGLRFDLDQFSRSGITLFCSGKEGKESNDCWAEIFRDYITPVDKENLQRVSDILEQYGYVSAPLWSDKAEQAVWFVVQHMPPETDPDLMALILPKVKESVEQGRLTGWHYAAMYDRHERYQGRDQLYGTQFLRDGGVYVPAPMQDPEGVDARRAALGMETLAEKLEKFNSR
ncbi:hypothetical protein GCM10007972_01340 [Iodidimonas muriae]|uniref:Uncharacterized protein n=1 Tax=Iodidimonas muriae TaxID=261467 RepID=A0ABQ2L642_9PROT|nr:DUF6624 domain-containing protein [Iodidimonas muriae]GER06422.1 hypothetical protein JCM17843_07320 [Kordiimonadales bacterium JCM 17843]GGO04702.1 hypothetical protein GCM10007972_01340 [Iodidimonas muriae]